MLTCTGTEVSLKALMCDTTTGIPLTYLICKGPVNYPSSLIVIYIIYLSDDQHHKKNKTTAILCLT